MTNSSILVCGFQNIILSGFVERNCYLKMYSIFYFVFMMTCYLIFCDLFSGTSRPLGGVGVSNQGYGRDPGSQQREKASDMVIITNVRQLNFHP